eukprot:6199433-Pleurochrysis_carterae.AAC.3
MCAKSARMTISQTVSGHNYTIEGYLKEGTLRQKYGRCPIGSSAIMDVDSGERAHCTHRLGSTNVSRRHIHGTHLLVLSHLLIVFAHLLHALLHRLVALVQVRADRPVEGRTLPWHHHGSYCPVALVAVASSPPLRAWARAKVLAAVVANRVADYVAEASVVTEDTAALVGPDAVVLDARTRTVEQNDASAVATDALGRAGLDANARACDDAVVVNVALADTSTSVALHLRCTEAASKLFGHVHPSTRPRSMDGLRLRRRRRTVSQPTLQADIVHRLIASADHGGHKRRIALLLHQTNP